MEKYQQHGLTREEDDILGAFGRDDISQETFPLEHFAGTHLEALKSLVRKGLFRATISEGLSIQLKLTRKGVALWRIRAKEEEGEPPC